MESAYYDEGDICPKCKKGMVIIVQCNDTGERDIKCQDCSYIATDDIKEVV